MYIYIYVYIYMYVYICMCVYIYIYILGGPIYGPTFVFRFWLAYIRELSG